MDIVWGGDILHCNTFHSIDSIRDIRIAGVRRLCTHTHISFIKIIFSHDCLIYVNIMWIYSICPCRQGILHTTSDNMATLFQAHCMDSACVIQLPKRRSCMTKPRDL